MSVASAMERDVSCEQQSRKRRPKAAIAARSAMPTAEKQFECIQCDAIDRIVVHTHRQQRQRDMQKDSGTGRLADRPAVTQTQT